MLTWDRRLCIHIGECGRAADELFVGGRDPWCQPDVVDSEEVSEVVRRCPTGAISYHAKDGTPAEAPPSQNAVVVANNGPLYVTGELDIDGAESDMPAVRFRAALCRCGKSDNKTVLRQQSRGRQLPR